MDYLTTRGLVLRTTEYKETDRILTVLSADRGLLTMKARGVRSNRSKLKGACQLLTYAEFTVGEAHGFSSITEATALEMFPELRTDIELLALASYFAQLAEVLSQEDAASPALLPLILNAGAVFLGENAPEPLGDYLAGPNHVLPTSGTARFFSPLSVDSFLKTMSVLEYSRENLQQQWKQIAAFANAESLTAHANSIEVRFEDETD